MDPAGLSRFLEKLAKQEGRAREMLSILTTHPASKERAQVLDAALARKSDQPVLPLRFDIKALKGRCDPVAITDPDSGN